MNLNEVYLHPIFLGFHFLYKKCDLKNVPFFVIVFFPWKLRTQKEKIVAFVNNTLNYI